MQYTYLLSTFPQSKCSLDRLQHEIEQSDIITAIDYAAGLSLSTSSATLTFKAALSAPEISALDAIVAAHSGEPLIPPAEVVVSNTSRIPMRPIPFDGPLYQTFCRFTTGKDDADPSWLPGGESAWSIDASTPGITKVKFQPAYSYQIDGAGFRLRGNLPTNPVVFSKVTLAPGIPAPVGSYVFIRNFEVTKNHDEYERITAPKFIGHIPAYPSANAIEFEITHDPGDFVPLMVFLSTYTVTP